MQLVGWFIEWPDKPEKKAAFCPNKSYLHEKLADARKQQGAIVTPHYAENIIIFKRIK